MGKEEIEGLWYIHKDGLYNGHESIILNSKNYIFENNTIKFIEPNKLTQSLSELEVIAITEKYMVLREELVIYVLFRNP